MTREESIARLDPELSEYILRPQIDLNLVPLSVGRAQADVSVRALFGPVETPPEVVLIAGSQGEPRLEVRVHRPLNVAPKSAILHVHGGGMVLLSAAALDARMASLADRLGSIIVSVEYRLAPETPFPGPLHDCVAAWHWMISQAENWGLSSAHCLISGDSAGGGLAAATCLYLRDSGGTMPARQILVYPMLDFQTGLGDDSDSDQRLGWNGANNQFGWRALLGDQPLPQGDRLGHYSPAHAVSFAGLPPTWIGVGTIDLFLDENIRFAAALAQADGDVTLCTYKGAPHGFQTIASSVSQRFYRDYCAAFELTAS
jgi:acetyl esterase